MKKILLFFLLLTYCILAGAQGSLPIDTAYPANNVTPFSAQLNGIVYTGADTAVVTFEYGNNVFLSKRINAAPDTIENTRTVSAVITGLTINTRYYYKVKAVNGGGTALSKIDSFYTSGIYALDTTLPATSINLAGATLNAAVDAVGSAFNVSFEYGTTPSLTDTVIATPGIVNGNSTQDISATLNGLTSNIQYYYRVKAVNDSGVYYGNMLSFLTVPQPPTDTTYMPAGINLNSAQFSGGVNANDDTTVVTFEYGTDLLSLVNTIKATPGTITGLGLQNVSALVTGLQDSTEYYYRVVATNKIGTTYGNIQQFYTGYPEIPNWDFEIWDTITSPVPVGWNGFGGVVKVPYNDGFAVKLYPAGVMNVGGIVFGGYIDDGFYGGVPFDSVPDSLAGYFNYDIAPGDTAYAGFFLERNDSLVSINADTFTGSSNGNFIRISIPVMAPTNDLPDTMMFLCLSSNIFGAKQLGNPNSTLTIADLSFIGGDSAALPNLAFTNWDTLSGVYLGGIPGQGQLYLGLTDIFEQTTDSYTGKYALRLNNDIAFKNIFHGRLSESMNIHSRHATFNGYLKWFPGMNDTMNIMVQMYKQGQQIGYGQLAIADSIPSYAPFACNIYYYVNGNFDSTDVPDSCNIYIGIQDQLPGHAQSIAYFDHFSFDEFNFADTTSTVDTATSITKVPNDNFLEVYPNPTTGTLNVVYTNDGPGQNTITIFDMSGRLIYNNRETILQTGKIMRELDMSGYLPGVYILTVVTGQSSLTKKIIVY